MSCSSKRKSSIQFCVFFTGPYVFAEKMERVNIEHHVHNGTMTYQTKRYWNFLPHLSQGSFDDNITTINFPLMVR